MTWFLDLSTRIKLFLGFGLMIVLLAAVIATAHRGISSIQASQRSLYQTDFVNAVDLLDLRLNQNGMRAALLSMMETTVAGDREAWHQDVKQRTTALGDTTERLIERNRDNPRLLQRLEEFEALWQAFVKTRDGEVIPLIYAAKKDEAWVIASGVQEERYRTMRALTQKLGDEAVAHADTAVVESEQRSEQAIGLFVTIGIAAVALGVALVLLLDRAIAVPLRAVSGLARKMADGDLTVDVPVGGRADEVGDLLRAFGEMVTKVRQTTRDLHEGVGVLASSASEILATTSQVASGAVETASAVSETTATVEEVKQTAQMASQKARFVS
ncbi:MAG: methyl-accepting chemotaxis protein, partial [Pseudomonadota bacterium]